MRIEGTGAKGTGERPAAAFGDALARARAGCGGRPAASRAAPGASGEDASASPQVGPPPRGPAAALAPALAPVDEIAALARALPPAVAAHVPACGAPAVALSLGRALEVELRSSPAGVEVVLRPEARLSGAARAELPRVVAALRVRGVNVSRAEVRPRGGAGGRAR
jgi:hypothetical protein